MPLKEASAGLVLEVALNELPIWPVKRDVWSKTARIMEMFMITSKNIEGGGSKGLGWGQIY